MTFGIETTIVLVIMVLWGIIAAMNPTVALIIMTLIIMVGIASALLGFIYYLITKEE